MIDYSDSIDSFLKGEEIGFRFIYDTTINTVFQTMRNFTVRKADEEIILKNVYLKFFSELNTNKEYSNVSETLEFLCMDECCHRLAVSETNLENVNIDRLNEIVANEEKNISLTEDELIELQSAIFANMSKIERNTFIMKKSHLPDNEIAKILHIPTDETVNILAAAEAKVESNVSFLMNKGLKTSTMTATAFVVMFFSCSCSNVSVNTALGDAIADDLIEKGILQKSVGNYTDTTAPKQNIQNSAGKYTSKENVSDKNAASNMVKGTKAAITKKTGGFIGTTVGKIVVVCITGGVIGCVAAGIINANNDNASGEAVSSVSTSSINSSSSSSSSIISSEEKNELTSTEIYTSIIDQYNSAISVFLAGESVTLDDYPDVNPYIFTEEYTSEPSFYYAYRDLDGNGVNELFVGIDSAYTNDESGSIISPDKIDIVSAYTIKDSKATQFLKTKQFTGISEVIPHYFVSNDNTIIQEGTELWFSDGADGTLLTTLTLSADILNMSDYLFHYNEGGAPHFWTDVKEAKAVPLLAPSSNASIELTDSDYAYYIGYNDFSFLEWGNDNSDVLNLDNKISEDEYFSKIAEYKNNVISLEWTKFNMDSNGYSTESSSTSTTEVQSDHSVFDTVLESYKDFIYNNNHYAKYISDYIIPYEEDENFVSDYNASFYYSYIDLNSDGSDELIIAYKTDDNTNYHLVSIFNTDGTTINQCDSWSANGSGRTYSELTTDGYISFVAMGSVREEDFSVTYQKILNDGTFREEESYSGSYAALDYHPALSLNNFSWQPL